MTGLVYGGYGSNADRARLEEYIFGSTDRGHGPHRGSADRSPIRAGPLTTISGRLYFGGRSKRWGAGVAFIDQTIRDSAVYVQTYRISETQLRDIARQEAAAPVDHPVDLPARGSSALFRPRANYGRLAHTVEGIYIVTSPEHRDPSVPSVDYVRRIAAGLVAGGLEAVAVRDYLFAAGERLSRRDQHRHRTVVETAMVETEK